MNRRWIAVGAFLLAAAVMLGAFGAHGLRSRLDPSSMAIYEKAVWYHVVHAAAVCFVGLLGEVNILHGERSCKLCTVFLLGVCLFSGPLYCLAISHVQILGAITPLGGVLFIVGWTWLGRTLWKDGSPER